MRHGSRRSGTAAHHLAKVATREADVTQQVVVELQQVGIGLPTLGATEQGRDHAHLVVLSVLGFGVAARNEAAYAGGRLNRI